MSEIECSNRPENIINGKIGCFCIDAMPENFSEVQQKIFFQEILKKNKKTCPYWILVRIPYQNTI